MILVSALRKRAAGRKPRSAKFAFYALAIIAASIATVATGQITPALANTPSITAPSPPNFASNTSGQEPGNFIIANFDASATLSISIGFVDPPTGTSFALPTTTGLTAGFGYNFSGNKTQISFTGTQANANTALAAMTVTTGSNTGNVTVRVSASISTANVYFNPINGNYYEFVSTTATTDCKTGADNTCITNIEDAINSKTLYGAKGYWATITSAQENSFVGDNMNAPNIAIGLSDRETEGTWRWLYGPEKGTATYFEWASGEPNNYSEGEDYSVTNWGGSTGRWNDFGRPAFGDSLAYIVEYSTDCYSLSNGNCVSGSFTGADQASASVTGGVDTLALAFSTGTTRTTNIGPYTFTVTFNVAVSGVESADFEDAGSGSSCTYSVTAVSTTVYTLTASSCFADSAEGTVIPRFKASGATRADGVNTNTGPLSAVTSAVTVTRDTTAPTVTSFSSTTSNGSYRATQSVNITAATNESVQSGNTMTVTLDTGATVALTAASAGTSLTGTYTVSAGHNSADLNVSSFTVGTVADTTGNAMTSTTVPSGDNNVAGAKAIVIDTVAPTAIGAPNLDAASDTGVSGTDDITSDTTPSFTVVISALELGATGIVKASKTGSSDVTCTLSSGSCTLGALTSGTWSIVSYQTDAAGNSSVDSTALSVVIDATVPTTATLAASSTTASSSTITFTVTGSEQLDCTSLSTTAGTDFTLTAGISAISSIAQTSNTLCTITATSTATAGGGAVTSTLTAAASFSISDPAGNALNTLTGSPQSITVTVPSNSPPSTIASGVVTDEECQRTNNNHPTCPGRQTTTTTTSPKSTSTTTTTVAPRISTPTTVPTQPRVSIPGAVAPKKVVVLTPIPKDDPTVIVADLVRQLTAGGDTQAAKKIRSAVISAAPAIGEAIADATEQLAKVLEDKSSTKLEIIKAKAAVADAASQNMAVGSRVRIASSAGPALPRRSRAATARWLPSPDRHR